MTLEHYAYLAEIIGVIIIVVTLIFLTVQARQNGMLLRSEARRTQVDKDVELIHTIIDSPDIAESFVSPGKLQYDKKIRLYFWLIAFCRAREHQWFEYRNAVLDETAWKSYSMVIPWAFGTERNRRYWKLFCGNFDSGFVELVNGMIEAVISAPSVHPETWQELAEMD